MNTLHLLVDLFYRRRVATWTLLLVQTIIIIGSSHFTFASSPESSTASTMPLISEPKHVLVLFSYHRAEWSDNVQKGIASVFAPYQNVNFFYEYMDTKRLKTKEYLETLRKIYIEKYFKTQIDVVFCVDNNALDLLAENARTLFPDTPVVFCGINDYSPALHDARPDVTGVVEYGDFSDTLKIAFRARPNATKLYIICDHTETGETNTRDLIAALSSLAPGIHAVLTDRMSFEELSTTLQTADPQQVAFFVSFWKDGIDRNIEPLQLDDVFRKSTIPVFGRSEWMINHGMVGGKCVTGFAQGEAAARIALQILVGTPVSALPVDTNSPNQYLFDHRMMKHYLIDEDIFPDESIGFNRSDPFYRVPKSIGAIVLFFSALLLAALVILAANIHQRKLALLALRESEERFRTLVNTIPDLIWLKDVDGVYLSCNTRFERLYGASEKDIVGKTDYDFVDRELADSFREHDRKAIAAGMTSKNEEWVTFADDGHIALLDTTRTLMFGAEGKLVGVLGVCRDITERKRAEEEIQAFGLSALRNESRLRRLLDILQHPSKSIQDFLDYALDQAIQLTESKIGYIYHYDENSKKFVLNTWSKEVMAECTVAKLSNCYELDKTGIWGEAVRQRRSIIVNDFKAANPLKKGYPEGHVHLAKFMTVPIFKNDSIVGVVGMANKETDYEESDILQVSLLMEAVWKVNERKQAELALQENNELLTLFVRHSPVYCYIKDVNSTRSLVLHASDNFLEMIGIPGCEMIGKKMEDLFPPEFASKITEDDWTVVSKGEVLRLDEELNGRSYTTIKFPIIQGGKTLLAGYTIDITDRKLAEEEKAKLKEQLLQALKYEAIGTLAGGIAHDFNNLLMGIQGRVSLLSFDLETTHPHREHINALEEYIRSATSLTRQLLGFARGGKYEVKPFDMNELVQGSSVMFGRTKKEIRIHTKCQASPPVVEGDRGQIEQVLLNMYVNAWQAMSPDGGELYLGTKIVSLDETYCKPHQTEPGRYINVSITDTGTGMDEAIRTQIFDPFFTTKGKSRGTGLGLASAFGIIKNHGGMITVYSEVGHGTTFNIYLPVSDKEAHLGISMEGGLIKGSATILLIDDEELIIDVGQAMLERLGYRVVVCREGGEAVKVITDMGNEIDLVLLDMIMPGMDGGTTFDRIHEIQPDMPVILSSGYSINGQADKIMRRGCSGFIQKPYNISELSQKIGKVLDKVKGFSHA